eukprot:s2291_g10.t1
MPCISRASAASTLLPSSRPRFLPLNCGNPIEVLQAVMLGVDIFELTYPMEAATGGIALLFDWEMPKDAGSELLDADTEALKALEAEPGPGPAPEAVRQISMRSPECREDAA